MKKYKILFMSFLLVLITFFCACNKDTTVTLNESSFEHNYVIGEDITIDSIILEVGENKQYLLLNKDYFEISGINKDILGKQNITINVKYDKKEWEFYSYINVNLPNEVNLLNERITNILNDETIDLYDEEEILGIDEKYKSLDSKYKSFINKYSSFEELITIIDNLKDEYITTEILNKRATYQNGLKVLYESIDSEDYSELSYSLITNTYNNAYSDLNKNYNYNKLDNIYNNALELIINTKTKAETNLDHYKEFIINSLENHVNSLDSELYSVTNYNSITTLFNEAKTRINSCYSNTTINSAYESYLKQIDDVLTLEEESKKEIDSYRLVIKAQIDSYYAKSNKTKVQTKYDDIVVRLNETTTKDEIDNLLFEFIVYCNSNK